MLSEDVPKHGVQYHEGPKDNRLRSQDGRPGDRVRGVPADEVGEGKQSYAGEGVRQYPSPDLVERNSDPGRQEVREAEEAEEEGTAVNHRRRRPYGNLLFDHEAEPGRHLGDDLCVHREDDSNHEQEEAEVYQPQGVPATLATEAEVFLPGAPAAPSYPSPRLRLHGRAARGAEKVPLFDLGSTHVAVFQFDR